MQARRISCHRATSVSRKSFIPVCSPQGPFARATAYSNAPARFPTTAFLEALGDVGEVQGMRQVWSPVC